MGSFSSWRTRVEKGVPKSPNQGSDTASAVNAQVLVVTGGGARKRGRGLDEEARANEDDDEDD